MLEIFLHFESCLHKSCLQTKSFLQTQKIIQSAGKYDSSDGRVADYDPADHVFNLYSGSYETRLISS